MPNIKELRAIRCTAMSFKLWPAYAWSIALCIGLVIVIITTLWVYHTDLKAYITITEKVKHHEGGFALSYGFSFGALAVVAVGLILSLGYMASPYFNHDIEPVHSVDAAMYKENHTIPRLHEKLANINNENSAGGQPTELEKQTVPIAKQSIHHKLHHEKQFVKDAKHLHVKWYYYL